MNEYNFLFQLGEKLYLHGRNIQHAERKIAELRESGATFSSAQILEAYRTLEEERIRFRAAEVKFQALRRKIKKERHP